MQSNQVGKNYVHDHDPPKATWLLDIPAKARPLNLGDLNSRVGYFVRRLQVAVFKDFIRTLAPMGVRPAQYSVLVLIAANPGRTQTAISKALAIERARFARMLHEFERRNWIERRASNRDRRSNRLFLTSEGEKAFKRMTRLVERHEARMSEIMGEERRKTIINLLREFG